MNECGKCADGSQRAVTHANDNHARQKFPAAFFFAILVTTRGAAQTPDISALDVRLVNDEAGGRARWDRDMANFNTDLKTGELFFLATLERRLSDQASNQVRIS
jgi:hypothetical protein